jgi:hypothetical protein
VALAGNPNPAAWQDSLVRHYYRQGLLDSAWVNNSARASYTHLNSQTHVPGGVATTTGTSRKATTTSGPTPSRPATR